MPGSGTSILEQIISSHKDLYEAGEVPAMEYISAGNGLA
jgi:hypothetical protein